jgi:hypothetical protein
MVVKFSYRGVVLWVVYGPNTGTMVTMVKNYELGLGSSSLFSIVSLFLKFKEVLQSSHWCNHSFLDHSKWIFFKKEASGLNK